MRFILWYIVIVFMGIFIAWLQSAAAQNIPTSPYGCFKEHGSDECYESGVDCGNSTEDVTREYLESLYGPTIADICIDNLSLIDDLDKEWLAGYDYSQALIERLRRKVRKRARKLKRCRSGR